MNSSKNAVLAVGMFALASVGSAFAAGAQAQQMSTAAAAPAANQARVAGEVRKVDLEQGKVTIRHDAIVNLDMPAMTMVFRAEKPELLKNVKAGDKIRFQAESTAGTLVVTHIEAAK